MLLGVAVLLRTEDYQDPQAVPPEHQRNGTVRSNSFDEILLFDLKFHLFLQVGAHDGFLVLEYPSMMRFFAVQQQANAKEAFTTAALGYD